jgi:hypothetical protein
VKIEVTCRTKYLQTNKDIAMKNNCFFEEKKEKEKNVFVILMLSKKRRLSNTNLNKNRGELPGAPEG